jgi:DNA-binding CsgD family transcriptional regulator
MGRAVTNPSGEIAVAASGGAAALSPRELAIVRLVALGEPNKRIADALGISPWTVATYVKRIYGKLGVNARAAMIACVLGAQCRSLE